jgi:FkbM family methyltransferase
LEAIAYFVKGTARELGIAPSFFLKLYRKILTRSFLKKWLKISDDEFYFDFKGVKLPYVPNSTDKLQGIISCFDDVFLIPCYFDDNYNKSIAELVDQHTDEGPYGYSDGYFDVTVKKDDVVIDVGAWIGDFSAYAASKGATVYAFEPVNDTFQLLRKTQSLNNIKEGGIYPIQKGLGDRECEMDISINEVSSGGNSIVTKRDDISVKERISITTLDRFVEENKLERVDFIKSDIEGAERDMLRGAANVLKTFAPKLAICTYHLPDDPNVLENIIKEANPAYTVVHLKHKLFAAVVNK